jgi:GT2 family glycosyltransferase
MYVPESIAHHIGSAITGDRSDFSVYHGHRNLVWTYVKNMPGILFWILLPIHLAFNFIAVLYFTIRGQGRIILRAKWDAIQGISKMWYKRRQIQNSRRASVMDIWRMLDKHIL